MVRQFEIADECIKASSVLAAMEEANNGLNIVILDACRDNPFRSFRSTGKGLAKMDAPTGSIIVYATAPGMTALDGHGRNGLYTSNFLKHIHTPGLPLENLLKKVRIDVLKASDQRQVPWESSSLIGFFSFVPGLPGQSPATTAAAVSRLALRSRGLRNLDQAQLIIMLKQKRFFDAALNPDGAHASSLTDNGDNTVTDTDTGLMWMKGGSSKKIPMSGNRIRGFLGELNTKKTAGYDDWSAPTLEELASLLRLKKNGQDLYIDSVFESRQDLCYSRDRSPENGRWMVDFSAGRVVEKKKGDWVYVRPVRSIR